jgi:hypothetical protein
MSNAQQQQQHSHGAGGEEEEDEDDIMAMLRAEMAQRAGVKIGTQAASTNLAELIDVKQSQALNSALGQSPLGGVIGTTVPVAAAAVAEEEENVQPVVVMPLIYSDASTDSEQLIITVEFKEAVRIESLILDATVCGVPNSAPPRSVKLFAQQPNYSFDDCETQKATFEARLSEAQLKGAPIPLPLARFGSITSVTLFFPNNTRRDATTTFVNRISFQGVALAGTKMSNLRSMSSSCC